VPRSKNVWSYTATPKYTFMAWCSVKARGQLQLFYLLDKIYFTYADKATIKNCKAKGKVPSGPKHHVYQETLHTFYFYSHALYTAEEGAPINNYNHHTFCMDALFITVYIKAV
jgi:hypothetical protein